MAPDEPNSLESQQKLGAQIHTELDVSDILEPSELSNPQETINKVTSIIEKLINERQAQRREMMNFVKGLTTKSFLLLVVVVIFQGFVRLFKSDYEVINDVVFNILAVSVFGQVISVIVVIVKSLWDDTEYLKKI